MAQASGNDHGHGGHGHGDHGHGDHAHDHDHDDHHEEAPPPEPETPAWLTLLGAVLFVGAGVVFLLMNSDSAPRVEGAEGEKPAKQAAAEPARLAPQAGAAPRGAQAVAAPAAPAVSGAPARVLNNLPAIQKLLDGKR
jgi:hypothetical protein